MKGNIEKERSQLRSEYIELPLELELVVALWGMLQSHDRLRVKLS